MPPIRAIIPQQPSSTDRKFLPPLPLSLRSSLEREKEGDNEGNTRREPREEHFSTRLRSVWSGERPAGHQRRNKKTLRTADVGARTTRKELQITRIVSESWLAAAREGILNKAAAALQLADLETRKVPFLRKGGREFEGWKLLLCPNFSFLFFYYSLISFNLADEFPFHRNFGIYEKLSF